MSENANATQTPVYPSLEAWIGSAALPVDMHSDEAFNTAVDHFIAALGASVEVLGLGEALHGGEEILQFRNRLFQRLVEQHGYSAIAIESSFPKSRIMNDFVTGKSNVDYEAIQDKGITHNWGGLSANRELAEWMRHYNAARADEDKIHFYGFDSPTEAGPTDSPRELLTFVLDYFAASDPAEATKYRAQMEPLLGEDAAWESVEVIMNPSVAIGLSPNAVALRIATENLISELNKQRPDLVAAQGLERYHEAMHYAYEARQLMNYHAVLADGTSDRQTRLMGIRDALMADNVAYIVERERPHGKVLLFAHNAHLQRSKEVWDAGAAVVRWLPAGAHLEVLFGTRYALIGAAVGTSEENGIAEPELNTLEAFLTNATSPVYLLPAYQGKAVPATALDTLSPRSGSEKNRSYFALNPQRLADFDGLVVFKSLTYWQRG